MIKVKATLSKYICCLRLLIKIMFLSIHKLIVLIGTASKQFDVLKEQYSRKKQALKKASRSRSGAKETEVAQKDPEP